MFWYSFPTMMRLRLAVVLPLLVVVVFGAPEPQEAKQQGATCLDFPTGKEEYLIIDGDLAVPTVNPDDEFVHGKYKIKVHKQNDGKGGCMFKIVSGYLTDKKIFTMKMGCLIDEPVGKVFTFYDTDVIVLKLANEICLRAEPVGDLMRTCVKHPCTSLDDFTCPDSAVRQGDGVFTMLDPDHWSKPYLQSLMKLRLVPKTMPQDSGEGSTIGKDKPLAVYPKTAVEAEKDMKAMTRYAFSELTLGVWTDKLEKVYDNTQYLDPDGKTLLTSNTPTIMIIHPISADGDSKFVSVTVKALTMMRIHRHTNIIVVDMPDLSENMFTSIINIATGEDPMIKPMAEALGDFFVESIKKGKLKAEDVHLIGWSYSATLAAYMGRYIEQQTTQKIGSIVALDPFGSTQTNRVLQPVNAQDALKVHVHHSNAFPFGSTDRHSTADFTYNNGFIQPECVKNPSPVMCSHKRVVHRFWYVILFGNSGLFEARQCDNLVSFNAGNCDKNPSARMTYPIADNPAKGRYFLRTLPKMPYGNGAEYSVSNPELREKTKKMLEENPNVSKRLDLMTYMGLSLNMNY